MIGERRATNESPSRFVPSDMIRRAAATGMVLLAGAALTFGQTALQITFPSAGPRAVWVDSMPPENEPQKAIEAAGAKVELKAPNVGRSDQAFVWDKASGNLAAKPIAQIPGGAWAVAAADYRWIMRVHVRVEHKGRPVQTASVRLRDGRQDVTQLLDSSGHGQVSFYAVKPGPVQVAVTYTSEGKTMDPLRQTFELSLKRTKTEPVLVVGIADSVATTGEAAATEEGGGPTGESAPPAGGVKGKGGSADATNPFGNLASFLISLVIAAGLFWLLWQWIRKNPAVVQDRLERMGVQVPRIPDADPSSATVQPVVAAPPEKILLDDASPVAPPVGVLSGISSPRLVGDGGDVFEIPEGESLVSRESGGLVIAGETTVSRRHATLVRAGSEVIVRDEGSTNGTYVNGVKLDGERTLAIGDTVQFGAARFRFEG